MKTFTFILEHSGRIINVLASSVERAKSDLYFLYGVNPNDAELLS